MKTTDTFEDMPVSDPRSPVREHMTEFWEWFQAQSPKRQEAYREKVRADNARQGEG